MSKSKGDIEFQAVVSIEDGVPSRKRGATYLPTSPDNAPVVLSFSDIVVSTKTSPSKTLLKNISGSITGGFWAIMGKIFIYLRCNPLYICH